MDEVHQRLADRYELGEVIGRGGMGTVYRAVDSVLGRPVAVKLLPGPLSDHDPTSVARFEREARAAAALNHPAVVAVYDTGADVTSRFIVMELIVGRSLEAILRQDGPLAPDRAAAIAARVADALAAAHAAGIVHRDIKPANVMVASDGTVKVLDFGIARAIDGTTLTQNAVVLGTAAYMSPEQASGQPADERSDIYSLGCVLYTMLAGHPPFSGDGVAAILHQHANIAPRPLRDEGNRVPRWLEAIVLQMLEKSPDQRPQSAAEVRDRLTTPIAGPPLTAATTPLGQITATRPLPPSAPVIRRGAGRRWLALAGSLAVVIVVVLAIALSSSGGSPRRTASADRHASAAKATATKARSHPRTSATTSTTTSSPTTTHGTGVRPRTVSAAAGGLTALVTRDVQAGTIDQQAAQQISNGLTNILNPWDMGNATNAQQQLKTLSQQVTMLEQQRHITSRAAPAINAAITNLGTTLASITPPTTAHAHPPAHPTRPGPRPAKPGHGGPPPGHAKHPGPHGH